MKWIFSVLLVLGLGQLAKGGGAVISFGGTDINRKIHTISQKLVTQMLNAPGFVLPQQKVALDIKILMATLKIEISKAPIFWEGAEVFAINYPEETPKRLVVSESKWLELESKSIALIEPLLLHEFLPLVHVVDRNYEVSESIHQVLSKWHSWDSTEYFMQLYLKDEHFLPIWAVNSKQYYQKWGIDEGALISYFAFYVFPTRQEDTHHWVTIFENYMNQNSTNICSQPVFEIQLQHLKERKQAVFTGIHKVVESWKNKHCKSSVQN